MGGYTLVGQVSGFGHRLALSQTGSTRILSGFWVKPPRLSEGSAGCAPNLHCIPWHLPYNCGKIKKKQSGYPKVARANSAVRNSCSRLGHHLAMASNGMLTPAVLDFHIR